MKSGETYFDDGEAYERLMGRWSRAAGALFLDWVEPPRGARWLDVGCGTGVFTELVLDKCAPAEVIAIDPAATQIEHARRKSVGQRAEFRIADALQLPFPDEDFDLVVSALVINFIARREPALAEMRRVARKGGQVAGYVWDFATDSSPTGILRRGLRQIGVETAAAPGTAESTLVALRGLFERAGLRNVEARAIDVTMRFPGFEDLWRAQTPVSNPVTKTVAALSESDRMALMEAVRAMTPTDTDGGVSCACRANAIKALVPTP